MSNEALELIRVAIVLIFFGFIAYVTLNRL